MTGGYIKLWRKTTEWEWYKNSNAKIVFFHLLLTASHKPISYKGVKIPPGCVLTSYPKLAAETGLTVSQVRDGITALKSTGEITGRSTGTGRVKGTLYRLKNWSSYQERAQAVAQPKAQ